MKKIKGKRNFLKERLKKRREKSAPEPEPIPRITNETVAQHREEVLSGARKFIYPLTHSKNKVIGLTTVIVLVLLISFFTYMTLSLYRFKSSSDFVYQTTKVLPFPIARVGSTFVPYEDYLFELKRYIHYYEEVEKISFDDPAYQPQLEDQKKRILEQVVDLAYIRKIANDKDIVVSEAEIDERVELLKAQNRLGNNDQLFEDTLRDYYDWTINDFRRSIRNEILISKVLEVVDVETRSLANSITDQIKQGADFAALAKQYSQDDQTKDNGGEIPVLIDPKSRDVPSEQIAALEKLAPGQVSEPVNTGRGYILLKKLEDTEGKYRVAQIVLNFSPIQDFLNDEKAENKARVFIKL